MPWSTTRCLPALNHDRSKKKMAVYRDRTSLYKPGIWLRMNERDSSRIMGACIVDHDWIKRPFPRPRPKGSVAWDGHVHSAQPKAGQVHNSTLQTAADAKKKKSGDAEEDHFRHQLNTSSRHWEILWRRYNTKVNDSEDQRIATIYMRNLERMQRDRAGTTLQAKITRRRPSWDMKVEREHEAANPGPPISSLRKGSLIHEALATKKEDPRCRGPVSKEEEDQTARSQQQ